MLLKAERRLLLFQQQKPVREFRVGLGFAPQGQKQQEGDGRTPEGRYFVDRKNPKSSYHLSVGINYPTPEQLARAQAMGVEPGGDIFFHGQPNNGYRPEKQDWTAGCIAVANAEIEEIYSRVPLGTPVTILA
nr:L,D-transpeptidase [Halovulum marinum]